jgi:hypothetical protein
MPKNPAPKRLHRLRRYRLTDNQRAVYAIADHVAEHLRKAQTPMRIPGMLKNLAANEAFWKAIDAYQRAVKGLQIDLR